MSRGRPKSKNPKTHLYKFRLDDEDWDKLRQLQNQGDVNIPEIFRRAIRFEFMKMNTNATIYGAAPTKDMTRE